MSDYSSEIARMQSLIEFGTVNESNTPTKSAIEHTAVGADGKTYGIIKEGTNYYIKVAPKKNSEILFEDYDYIGGISNKKKYEYSSYNLASKQFDLKMMSLNEAYGRNDVVPESCKPVEINEWQTNESREMRAEIERFNQIVSNVDNLLSENNNYFLDRPTACGKNAKQGKEEMKPYTEILTNVDMEFGGEKANDPTKADDTYSEKAVADEDFEGKKHTDPKTADDTYSEKAPKVNEGRTFRLTEEQVLAWSKSKNYMDMSKGTEIGSSKPYEYTEEEVVNEETQMSEFGDTDIKPLPAGIGDPKSEMEPYDNKVNEEIEINEPEEDDENVEDEITDEEPATESPIEKIEIIIDGKKIDLSEILDDEDLEIEEPEDDLDIELDGDTEDETLEDEEDENYDDFNDNEELDDIELEIDDDTEEEPEISEINESNDPQYFGKHPAYGKEPMEYGEYEEPSSEYKDWNDDSVKGRKPFGQRKGSSAPYTDTIERVINEALKNLALKKK